ncbi:ABC1-domain-containing protein [Rhizoclosmatium globosum]|uniref:ABC1-domain-containing protein n=1 Tax=Rhizoclosmatium globosum TaxID=329046 RepID=A0A1Y2CPP6_9FUNG|nr:ABC1-domain-containing protein [Rhizoclosmatium globosum]|eukprot:ORY49008.1 ABC1-domain-containing protein [Rhizoclosmatium globosum]
MYYINYSTNVWVPIVHHWANGTSPATAAAPAAAPPQLRSLTLIAHSRISSLAPTVAPQQDIAAITATSGPRTRWLQSRNTRSFGPAAVALKEDKEEEKALDVPSLQIVPVQQPHSVLFVASLVLRVVWLGFIFLPVLVALPLFMWLNSKTRARLYFYNLDSVRGLWFVQLLTWSLQSGGPAFIKLAQFAKSLGTARSWIPHSMIWTRRAFQKENVVVLGGAGVQLDAQTLHQLKDLFDEFDENPVGVGAIAQVCIVVFYTWYTKLFCSGYKARLKQSQKVVAVKILHPHVSDLINKDLIILEFAAHTLTYLFPNNLKWLSLPDEVAVFSAMMRSQTDLRTEANNLIQFRNHFKNWAVANSEGGGAVWFPQPILSSPSILVEEYIDAIPISRFLSVQHAPPSTDDLVVGSLSDASRLTTTNGTAFDVQLAKIGMRSFVKMLLVDNFCHADLHPGNIQISFVANHSDTVSGPEVLARLPVGVTSLVELDKLSDAEFMQTMDEFHKFDGKGVARLLVERQRQEIGDSPDGGVIDFDGFSDKMAVLLNRIRDSSLKLSTVSFSWILRQVFGMVRTHHVRLEGDFANVGVAVMLVEGVGRQLDPGVDLLEEVRGVVIREWVLAVGDLYAVRAVLEVYAYAKHIGREMVSGKWPVFAK